MLTNESYNGRLVFRRTKWVSLRSGKTGILKRRAVQQPEDEWLEITGASPQIVDNTTWQRVQQILTDPERIARCHKALTGERSCRC
jgi:hypothetical protein